MNTMVHVSGLHTHAHKHTQNKTQCNTHKHTHACKYIHANTLYNTYDALLCEVLQPCSNQRNIISIASPLKTTESYIKLTRCTYRLMFISYSLGKEGNTSHCDNQPSCNAKHYPSDVEGYSRSLC